ncbi:hypothetical protein F5148DRAFT_867866 [Russula earlei]|uniref:Uncharacterized protein n=1 Tax=Russula earlei TaxID=71964 RepID=A0ACC0TTU0_9AGAM|nr:hypothetical protein F5148DRAFT_867866 [Russula earlei]
MQVSRYPLRFALFCLHRSYPHSNNRRRLAHICLFVLETAFPSPVCACHYSGMQMQTGRKGEACDVCRVSCFPLIIDRSPPFTDQRT